MINKAIHDDLLGSLYGKKYSITLNAFAFFAFSLLVMDCAVSGGGHYFMIGPLSLRMILGFIALFCALPTIFSNLREWIKNAMIISLFLFIIYLCICAYIGIRNHADTVVLLRDLKGFSWLFLIPVALAVVNSHTRMVFLMKCIICATTLQALLILALNLLLVFRPDALTFFYEPMLYLQFGFIDSITNNMTRIFSRSGPYMAIGIIIMFYLQLTDTKLNWIYIICSSLCLNALLLSFTRSLYAAACFSFMLTIIFTFILTKHLRKKILCHILAIIVFFTVLLISQYFLTGANYFQFAVARTFSLNITNAQDSSINDSIENTPSNDIDTSQQPTQEDTTDSSTPAITNEDLRQQNYIDRTRNSDEIIRNTTIAQLKKMIAQHPIFGSGLGSTIEYREDGLVEYFYYDMLNKTGFAGLFLYYFPILQMVYFTIFLLKKKKGEQALPSILLLCSLMTFLIVTFFNPYMNAAIGISFYSIVIGYFYMLDKYKTTMK